LRWFDENEIRKWFFGATDFYECCSINLTDLHKLAERGTIGKGKFIKLIDWLYFRR